MGVGWVRVLSQLEGARAVCHTSGTVGAWRSTQLQGLVSWGLCFSSDC